MTRVPPDAVITRSMVISERVSVPVLSEQMTEAEPSVSTDESFLTMALRFAIRCTPIASTTDRIAGRPSGTAATASDTPSSRTVMTSAALRMSEIRSTVATTTTAMTTTAMPSMRPIRATSFCSGVGSSSVASSISAIEPIWVSMPVAVTTARPGALRDGRALEDHVEAIAERRRFGQRRGILEHGLALAGQRGFLHAQRRGLHEARVGTDRVTLAEHEHVAADQSRRWVPA